MLWLTVDRKWAPRRRQICTLHQLLNQSQILNHFSLINHPAGNAADCWVLGATFRRFSHVKSPRRTFSLLCEGALTYVPQRKGTRVGCLSHLLQWKGFPEGILSHLSTGQAQLWVLHCVLSAGKATWKAFDHVPFHCKGTCEGSLLHFMWRKGTHGHYFVLSAGQASQGALCHTFPQKRHHRGLLERHHGGSFLHFDGERTSTALDHTYGHIVRHWVRYGSVERHLRFVCPTERRPIGTLSPFSSCFMGLRYFEERLSFCFSMFSAEVLFFLSFYELQWKKADWRNPMSLWSHEVFVSHAAPSSTWLWRHRANKPRHFRRPSDSPIWELRSAPAQLRRSRQLLRNDVRPACLTRFLGKRRQVIRLWRHTRAARLGCGGIKTRARGAICHRVAETSRGVSTWRDTRDIFFSAWIPRNAASICGKIRMKSEQHFSGTNRPVLRASVRTESLWVSSVGEKIRAKVLGSSR